MANIKNTRVIEKHPTTATHKKVMELLVKEKEHQLQSFLENFAGGSLFLQL